MRPQGVIGVVIVAIIVIVSIIVGNLFFSRVIGIDVGKLPPFLKFVVHMIGAMFVLYAAKKFLNK